MSRHSNKILIWNFEFYIICYLALHYSLSCDCKLNSVIDPFDTMFTDIHKPENTENVENGVFM